MINAVPPAAIFLIGAIGVPLLKGRTKTRKVYLLFLPILGFINILYVPLGKSWVIPFFNYDLVLGNVDKLSLLFGYIFHIVAFLTILYAISIKTTLESTAGIIYTGSVLGVTFSGDLISLFFFWELMTLSAVFLLWARRTDRAIAAGFRYVIFHFFGSVILLVGIILHIHETGSTEFGYIGLDGLASYLIFFGFGVNCAWPLLHTWLTDSYAKASVMGTVFMSAYTTKCAVYVLARSFPGTELLIWIGAVMVIFPLLYALIENDLRMSLSFMIVNQVGFMVIGIGIGTELAINGVASHAFAHILYDSLLFMALGAVLQQTGKIKATNLGGLYKSMPLTCIFCIIGAASISAVPLFSGFVSKSMVITAVAQEHMTGIWFILLFASAGVLICCGIKLPYFTFFARDAGIRPEKAPINMHIAMGIAAFLCIFIGVYPQSLYSLLPYPVDYQPYTGSHVISQLQLLFFGGLAFVLLKFSGIYPSEIRAINIDSDWIFRKGAKTFLGLVDNPMYGFVNRVKIVFF
ncbi:MAG: Na(+)/H(+) antiporter subunit D, partial [Candidatus Anammoxibacter sp.]